MLRNKWRVGFLIVYIDSDSTLSILQSSSEKEDYMVKVSLRPITKENFNECISLEVADHQKDLVATNVKSLAEAYVNPMLYPFGIYDASGA